MHDYLLWLHRKDKGKGVLSIGEELLNTKMGGIQRNKLIEKLSKENKL